MAFTAKDVRTLREMTGVGMMDCKKALTASDGDMDKAVAYLREKGLAAAQKKAGRIAAEGVVAAIVTEAGVGAIVEVNSETDFVAKNKDFQKFVYDVAGAVAQSAPADMDALLALPYPGSDKTIQGILQEKVLVIGENIKIRRFARYGGGVTVAYVHMGGKIGVLVNMEISDNLKGSKGVTVLGKDIAMQIAAMRPLYLDPSEVPGGDLEKEKEIQFAKALEENKEKQIPEEKAHKIAENMVKGRINKFYEETCLLNQPFVKENKVSVAKHVEATAKELGGAIAVRSFIRFEKGEGLEKKADNFAEEVASMTK
ncbi:MAG: translation elongation factor Ts [Oscillospiraceae bacterium]|nr:translation elongation factor Ts [Oscillospiraceae bacterium]